MNRIFRYLVAAYLLLSLQSCFVKSRPNMAFVDRSQLSREAEVVSIKVPGLLMKAFLRGEIKELKEEDPMLALAVKKIKGIKIMAIEGGGDGHRIYQDFSKYLNKNKFEEMMSIYSDGAKISINTLMKGDRIKNILLGVVDEEDHVFIDMKTDLDLNELNQLVEHYEKIHPEKKKTSEPSVD
ncbi:DUF4252 domain-containing protein [Sphingobacterium kyonggiense]